MQIGIAGITGRMGRMLAEAVPAAGGDLVGGVGHDGDLAGLAKRCDAVIDFTHESTVARHAEVRPHLRPEGVHVGQRPRQQVGGARHLGPTAPGDVGGEKYGVMRSTWRERLMQVPCLSYSRDVNSPKI